MAAQPIIRVEGSRQLRASMRRAGHDLGELKAVNADVAAVAARAGRMDAPVRTGTLAASVRPGATRTQAIVRAGGARVPYAGPIHWGWPARHINPHPFLVDGAHDTESTWLGLYQARIDQLLARIEGANHP